MLPNTPLLVAPSDLADPFGKGMHHADLIKGIRRVCPSLCIPDPSSWQGWYPGKDLGMTSIWTGTPQAEGVAKVCSFHLGWVPEFTQTSPAGIIRKGWRQILMRLVGMRLATKHQLEKEFKCDLTHDGKDVVCPECQMDGLREKATHASGLCDQHQLAKEHVTQYQERKAQEREDLLWAIS